MLRIALSASLFFCFLGLYAIGWAQTGAPAAAERTVTAPALPASHFELAQNSPQSLVERLRAIRSGSDSARSSSRRTADRSASDFAVPPTNPAPAAAEEFGEQQSSAPASDLPSVLVRRGAASPAAPRTDSPSGIPLPETTRVATAPADAAATRSFSAPQEDTWGVAGAAESSRRTARRAADIANPTYQAPAGSAFTSTAAASGAQISLSQQAPLLRIETAGPETISLGKPAAYQVRLINSGSTVAHRVVVTVTLPRWAQVLSAQAPAGQVNQGVETTGDNRITWDIEQLAANAQSELALSLQATENQPLDLQVDWICRPSSLAARIEVQQPQLALGVEGPVEMRYGETKLFQVRVSNPGNGPAENVVVNLMATGIHSEPNRVGTLGAGESRVLEVELTAQQAGAMRIQAAARGDGDLSAEANHEVRVRRAELAIEISAPELIYAGTTANYRIRVSNRGDAIAEGVVMQVDLPSGAEHGIGVDKQPITLAQPRWRIGDLSPGTEQVYSLQCDLTVGGENQLVARLQGVDGLTANHAALTKVEAIADLKLVVNDPQGPIQVGQDAVYEIEVLNRGSKAAQDVKLVAQFSEGIEPATAAGHDAEIVPGQVVFEPIATVPAGGKITLRITARATVSGNLRFRAELNCGSPETKLVAEESTRFYGQAPAATGKPSAVSASREPTPARR